MLEVLEGHPGFWATRQVIPPSRAWFADWRTVSWQQVEGVRDTDGPLRGPRAAGRPAGLPALAGDPLA